MRKVPIYLAAACLMLTAGCQAEYKYAPIAAPQAEQPAPRAAPAAARGAPAGGVTSANADAAEVSLTEGRKIVYTADLTLVVGDVEHAMRAAMKIAKEAGGYLDRLKGRGMVIRVPAERFDQAVDKITGLGTVAEKSIAASDVTNRYMDLETRLANAKALAGRLRALLANSTVKEAIQIEHELARVQTDIDRLEGQLKLLASQTAFATISMEFHGEVRTLPPALKVNLPFAWLHSLGLDRLLQFGGRTVY
jgi:hypothetical protein